MATLEELSAEVARLREENARLVTERLQEKSTAVRKAAELRFEQAIEAKRLMPSARERYFKWTFPKDDEAVAAFDLGDVDKFIEENRVNMSDNKGGAAMKRENEEGKTPDVVVAQRVRIKMSENDGLTYRAAMVEVLRDDPSLADEYRYMPDRMFK